MCFDQKQVHATTCSHFTDQHMANRGKEHNQRQSKKISEAACMGPENSVGGPENIFLVNRVFNRGLCGPRFLRGTTPVFLC